MKYLIFLLLLISFNVYAVDSDDINSAGFRGLSEIEKAEIIKMVAEKAKQKNQVVETIKTDEVLKTLEDTDKWVNIGTSLGKGLAATAKELGVAANDLATTRIGMIATTLIVWNFLGDTILHIIAGFILLIVGLFVSNTIALQSIVYDEQTNWLGFKKIKSKQYKSSDDWLVTVMVIRIVVLLCSIVLIV